MMIDLAVVIVNYNTRDDLGLCLASLTTSVHDLRCRIVVVDNASFDGSAEMVRDQFPQVDLVVSAHNGGYAYANNLALRRVGFEQGRGADDLPRYALLLNPDTVLPPEALARTVAYMDAHTDVGAMGPRLVRTDGSLDKACRRSFPTPLVSFYHLSGLGKLFPQSKRFARYNLTFLDEHQPAEVDALVGAYMLIRGEALEQAGLLDEVFFMYGEDLDLCYRIKQQGWRIVYEPMVTVLHRKGAASRKASRRAIAAFYDAMKLFHDKHYRAQTFFAINWIIDVAVWAMRTLALMRDRLTPPEQKHVASA